MTTKTVYGRAAYEGFAKAIGSRLGLKVRVVDGPHACIDAGGVIQLPGMHTHQTQGQFAITCGTVVHELSHQFYGSHKHIDPIRDRLEHDCLNAVLDVADETWISAWFDRAGNSRPGELLTRGNEHALRDNAQAFADWQNPATHAWKVLCVGILGARLNRRVNRWKRWTAQEAAKFGVDAKACYRLLRCAKRAGKQDPSPTPRRFKKLIDLAKRLAALLKPFAPPAGTAANVGSPIDAALGVGQVSPSGPVATQQDGANIAEGTQGTAGGFGSPDAPSHTDFDPQSFSLLSPAIQKVAQRIATDGEGATCTDGLLTGSRIGQAHRLLTDGQCLARWDDADHADGVSVSVLLDCSGSMNRQLAECAGIARAFALNMRQAGAVQSLAFGDVVRNSDDFSTVQDMGGTNTHLALQGAIRWLSDRSGRRWVVLVTDGQPNDARATERVCQEAAALGIHILAVGLGCAIRMPATCVTAGDPAHLAIELDAAAHRIERN